MHRHDDDHLPILDAVVRGGDEAIIDSLRLGRETLAELEALRAAALAPLADEPPTPRTAPDPAVDGPLERHVDALRRELRELLCGPASRVDA